MIFKTFVLCSSALLSCIFNCKAQDGHPLEKNAVSFQIMGGTALAGFVYERAVAEHLSLEVGAGWISGMAGLKYFPFKMKTKKLLPSIGVQASASPLYSDCELCFGGSGFMAFVPLGLSFYGKNGLNLGLDLGVATVFEDYGFYYGGLKVGKRF